MIIDTDVVIWFLRGHERADDVIGELDHRVISVVSYMELVRGARSTADLRQIKGILAEAQFTTVPLSEKIGQRASLYLERYYLGSGIGLTDALIAATAAETREVLCTGNRKHYQCIPGLELKVFRP